MINGHSHHARGVAALAGASAFIATSNVVFGGVVQTVPPFVLALLTFTVAAAIFGVANRGPQPSMNGPAWRAVVGLNLASAGVFVLLYTGLEYLEPALASALQTGASPVFGLLLAGLVGRHWSRSRREWVSAATIIVGSVLLGWVSASGNSGFQAPDRFGTLLGLLAVLGSGLCMALLTWFARRLVDLGWSNRHILAHRNYATIVGCGLLSLTVPVDWGAVGDQAWLIVAFGAVGLALPLGLLQAGVRHAAPFVVLAMTNCNPVLTYLIQLFDPRVSPSPYTLVGIAVVFIGVIAAVTPSGGNRDSAPEASTVDTPESAR
ncbi:DMT family transporter [Nocardiopsis rhodophaea]|uniref:DMT family transporter n=1 Tax=Nocardiopsis rhodophaea TaxID=280238 RepID=UPI0031D2098B